MESTSRAIRLPVMALLAAAVLVLGCHAPDADTAAGVSESVDRVVVIGDIHGDLGAARDAFALAGGINESGDWIGGDLVIVQLGDSIGRSYEDRQVLDFLLAVRRKAADEGGAVHLLIGNHEIFGARLELRWVHERAYEAFEEIPGLDVDNPLLAEIATERRARCAALMPGGPYARQLAEFPVVLRLGDTIFVHGGVTPYWAEYGVDRINAEVARWFAGETEQPESAQGMDPGNLDDNVTMSRHFSSEVGESDCAMLEESLSMLGAKRMIVAHTVQDSITARCDDRVWAVDVGMSRYYGGEVQVLEIVNDEVISVISR